jgi:uncharacterized protein (TIGR02145 family)
MTFSRKTLAYTILAFAQLLLFANGCKKDSQTPATALQTDSITDIDGNVYKTVKIGNQWWMSENLKVRKYRNGQYLFATTSSTTLATWDTITKGALCLYNDDLTDSTGYLYNWFAISDTNNIAPQGWHIPTDDEWKQLETTLGMSQSDADKSGWRGTGIAEKLKMKGQDYWADYGTIWNTNQSGFSAMAGGCRMFNGTTALNQWSTPSGLKYAGFWWTASQNTEGEVWYRNLDYKNSTVLRAHTYKNYGFSIRCVKD